jgi:hypothetical protein
MKLILAFCLFVCAIHGFPTGEDDHGQVGHVHETGPFSNIRKTSAAIATPEARRFGSQDSQTNVQCAATCARQMKEKMSRDLPGYEQEASAKKLGGEYDPEKLNKVCGVHDATKSCLDRCQNSQVKTMMTKALGLGQYMCHDSNFKKNAPCLNEVHKTTHNTCEGQSKCGQYKQKMDQYKQNRPTDKEGLKDMMSQSCQFMKCALDCAKPTVVSKCGQSAQTDLEGLVGKSVEFLKYTVESMNLGDAFPSQCERVASG